MQHIILYWLTDRVLANNIVAMNWEILGERCFESVQSLREQSPSNII